MEKKKKYIVTVYDLLFTYGGLNDTPNFFKKFCSHLLRNIWFEHNLGVEILNKRKSLRNKLGGRATRKISPNKF